MRTTTFCVVGSTIAREFSALFRTRSAGEGVGLGDCGWLNGAQSITVRIATNDAMIFLFMGALRLKITEASYHRIVAQPLLAVLLVRAFGFDVHELKDGAGAVGFDAHCVLLFFCAGFQGDF